MRSIEACEENRWSIATWAKDGGENPQIHTFKCGSWRHEGACRAECGAIDFARITAALQAHRFWTYVVLTYSRSAYPDIQALFRSGKDHWSILRKRLVERYGKFLYIQTWEIHKSKYPHINVVISSEKFYRHAETVFHPEHDYDTIEQAAAAGFGIQTWVEPIKNRARMAGYLTKLGLELTGQAVKDQTPVNAPPHFRRIRASRGLLPPRFKHPDITGQLFRVRAEYLSEQLNGHHEPPDLLADPELTGDFSE